MILIDEILIEGPVVDTCFACDLSACKGACCWEGDFGAPLEEDEMLAIEKVLDQVKPLLSDEARAILDSQEPYTYFEGMKQYGTPLAKDKSCIYLIKEGEISYCSFESLYQKGEIAFRKPISCHLYPIRIEKNSQSGLSLMRYDEWEICDPALANGKSSDTKIYKFAKEALIRKYGQEFYDRLDQIVNKTP